MTAKQRILKVLREAKRRDAGHRPLFFRRLREAAARLAKADPSPDK